MTKKRNRPEEPRELERAGALCLAFANTAAARRDDRRKSSLVPSSTRLETYADLLVWTQRMGVLDAAEAEQLGSAAAGPEKAAAILARALELRAALVRIFTAQAIRQECRTEDLKILNAALRARHVVPAADGFRRQWSSSSKALDRPLWPIAHSAAKLLSGDRRLKVRQCATRGCRRLFVYANSRRLWCDPDTCGNRDKGRRYHDRIRRVRRQVEEQARRKSERRIAEYLRMKAERGEAVDPAFGLEPSDD